MKVKTTARLTTLLITGLLVTACQIPAKNANNTTTKTQAEQSHKTHDNKYVNLTKYTCEPVMDIKAHYIPTTDTQDATAHVLIDDIKYVMHIDVSASGALYRTKSGLTDGNGLIWHTKGKEAILESFDISNPHNEASIKTIARCQES